MHQPIRQCAWCRRIADADGQYGSVGVRKLYDATHGICPGCKDRVRADYDRSTRGAVALAA
jgi:hypothetical protein